MFKFDNYYKTTKKSKWRNTCEFIVLHHTGGGTYAWNCRYLSGWKSTRFNPFCRLTQRGECEDWRPERYFCDTLEQANGGKKVGMNKYSMWIELVWPPFTDAQYRKLVELVKHLQKTLLNSKGKDIETRRHYTGRRKARKKFGTEKVEQERLI